jgi:nucleoside 2-deoxyribosyltransferase
MNLYVPWAANGPLAYLAGPTVFLPDPFPRFARMKQICHQHGITGIAPLDNQIGLESEPLSESLIERIVIADIELMDRADAGIFCLDGFRRSTEMDSGTAFELGYMRACKKRIVGWTTDRRDYPAKVADFFDSVFHLNLVHTSANTFGGTSGTMRDPDGVLVHSNGCYQNAMIDFGIRSMGGEVAANPDWELAFAGAVAHLASMPHHRDSAASPVHATRQDPPGDR